MALAALLQCTDRRANQGPTILCLDGFMYSGEGWFGGRGGAKKTRLRDLPSNFPHFGFDPTAGGHVHG